MNKNSETLRRPRNFKFCIFVVMRRLFTSKKDYKTIDVEIPIGFMNCRISTCNNFIADTNNVANWDTLKFPLPKPKYKWNIKAYKGDINKPQKQTVELIDCPQLMHNTML